MLHALLWGIDFESYLVASSFSSHLLCFQFAKKTVLVCRISIVSIDFLYESDFRQPLSAIV